jgi:GH25 family lysozyme M1 (1,4-beta-N-acetylmuramidase)
MSIKVIDISYWQQGVNYAVLAPNIDGVILRAAWQNYKDTMFETHYAGFANHGIPVGVYHYITGYVSPRLQAEAFAAAIKGKELRLGLWNDVEEQREGLALTRAQVLEYHRIAEGLVGEMGVYTSASKWDAIMRQPDLSSRKLWIANYGVLKPMLPRTGGWQSWWLWQYSDKGTLPGYHSSLDMNHFNGDKVAFDAWVGNGTTPEPPIGGDVMYVIEMLGNLVIRSAPNGLATGAYALKGETHHSSEMQDGWYKIARQGVTGWISGLTQWTRITKVEQPPEPEPPVPPLTIEQRLARIEKHLGLE